MFFKISSIWYNENIDNTEITISFEYDSLTKIRVVVNKPNTDLVAHFIGVLKEDVPDNMKGRYSWTRVDKFPMNKPYASSIKSILETFNIDFSKYYWDAYNPNDVVYY